MPRGGPGPTPHPPQTHGNGRLTPARYAVPLPAKLLSMWPSAPPSAAAASAPVLPCTRRAYRAARAAGCGQTGGHGRVAQRPPPRPPPGPHLQLGGLPLQPLRGQVGGLLAAPQEEIPAGQRDGDRERRGAGGGRTEGRTAPHSLTDGVGGEEHRAALQPQGGGPRGAQRGRRRLCGTGSSSGEGDRGGRAAQERPRPPAPQRGPAEGLTSGLGPAELYRSGGASSGRHHLQRRRAAGRHPQLHGHEMMKPEAHSWGGTRVLARRAVVRRSPGGALAR